MNPPKHRNHLPAERVALKTSFAFSSVWVIQSLRETDFKSGKQIHNMIQTLAKGKYSWLQVEFVEVDDKKGLFETLSRIKSSFQDTGKIPLIHFETHGDQDGLELRSGEFVPYTDLCPLFREINILTKNNLFIVSATCHGGHLAFLLHGSITEPCPFWGILGETERVSQLDVVSGYSAFYRELLDSVNINSALCKLNEAVSDGVEFEVWNSEYLFMLAFKYYLENTSTPDAMEQRTEALLKESGISPGDTANLLVAKSIIHQCIGTEEGHRMAFEKRKKAFLMHDIYPGESLPDPSFDTMKSFQLVKREEGQ